MGVGLAFAVLIDATIIRGVLLPASMKLLGEWNWYLPAWLEGLLPGGTGLEPAINRPDAPVNVPIARPEPAAAEATEG